MHGKITKIKKFRKFDISRKLGSRKKVNEKRASERSKNSSAIHESSVIIKYVMAFFKTLKHRWHTQAFNYL